MLAAWQNRRRIKNVHLLSAYCNRAALPTNDSVGLTASNKDKMHVAVWQNFNYDLMHDG